MFNIIVLYRNIFGDVSLKLWQNLHEIFCPNYNWKTEVKIHRANYVHCGVWGFFDHWGNTNTRRKLKTLKANHSSNTEI